MRTTLTLDPDVSKMLEEEAHRLRKPFKLVVNDAIRRGLSTVRPNQKQPVYRAVPHRGVLRPGIDRQSLNRLAADVDDEAIVRKFKRQ